MRQRIAILGMFLLSLTACAEGNFQPNLPDNSDPGYTPNSSTSPNSSSFNSSSANNSTTPADCISPPCDATNNSSTTDGCVDGDGDGYGVQCAAGLDCDDENGSINPGATEICDEQDNDCDGAIDEMLDCEGCNDADGDGYGLGCDAGSDCDDTDPERFEGAPEACDGKDNNCDGTEDEGFDVGSACSAGMGVCAADGTNVCSSDGTGVECDAPVGTPQSEVCDGLDNDCDGTADEGLNCPDCIEDANEPDDRSLEGTSISVGESVSGQLCPGDVDWFRLGSLSAGQTVSITAQFDHSMGDIDMEMYIGSAYETGSYSGTDDESITQTLSKSGNVAVWLYYANGANPTDSGSSYTVSR